MRKTYGEEQYKRVQYFAMAQRLKREPTEGDRIIREPVTKQPHCKITITELE